jgi:hypothetical protein
MKPTAWLVLGALLAVPSASAETEPVLGSLWLSLKDPALVGGVQVDNGDVVACRLLAVGEATQCDWSLAFDGSDVGLTTRIAALDVLPGPQLIMRLADRQVLPGLNESVGRRDVVLFTATQLGEQTAGTWSMHLRGLSSTARQWDGLSAQQDGSILLSLPDNGAGLLGGLTVRDEDIVRCTPSAIDVHGVITACDYEMFFDASEAQVAGNIRAFDVDPLGSLLLVGRGSGLPPHDVGHDIVRYVGTFGDSPAGRVRLYFRGVAAGLNGVPIGALALVSDPDDGGSGDGGDGDDGSDGSDGGGGGIADGSDADGDETPDSLDNCPAMANPGQEDLDGDGQGDACDPCRRVAGATPLALTVKRLLLAFPGGAGGGDDQLKRFVASFQSTRPFDLDDDHDLHLTLSRAEGTRAVVFAASMQSASGHWRQRVKGTHMHWVFRAPAATDRSIRKARVRNRLGSLAYRIKAKSRHGDLASVPLDNGEQLRVLVEIADVNAAGGCFEQTLPCKRRSRTRNLCRLPRRR